MANQSFYIPDSEGTPIMRRLNRKAKEKNLSVSQLLLEILKNYFQISEKDEKKSKGWATEFCGAWTGNLKAKPLIKKIENKRSRHQSALLK